MHFIFESFFSYLAQESWITTKGNESFKALLGNISILPTRRKRVVCEFIPYFILLRSGFWIFISTSWPVSGPVSPCPSLQLKRTTCTSQQLGVTSHPVLNNDKICPQSRLLNCQIQRIEWHRHHLLLLTAPLWNCIPSATKHFFLNCLPNLIYWSTGTPRPL